MPSTFGGINTTTLGLMAQQVALNTTGHNVANASTTGYSRQTANLATTPEQTIFAGNGAVTLGTGVAVDSITRARNAFADKQYWQQSADKGYWQTESDMLGKVEDVFKDTDKTGVQATMNKFWSALSTLAANASDTGKVGVAARTNVRETANSFVQLLQQDASTLQATAGDITAQISTEVTNINSISKQIADLNQQIVAQETGQGQKANDLRDKRDNLVDQLSVLGTVNVSEDAMGNYHVSMESTVLVNGQKSYPLAVQQKFDSLNSYTTSNVVTTDKPPQVVTFSTGKMASLVNSRDQITDYLGDLDNMAKFLMQDFNTQHKAGKDGDGNAGDNFFGVSGVDYTAAVNDPTTGTPPISWLSKLCVNAKLYGIGGEKYIAASDGSAGSGSANGQNALSLANVLQNGTTPTPQNALGNVSLPAYYSSMTAKLGVASQQAGAMNTNQGTLLASTDNWRQTESGVSLNEELSNMIKFQTAYGAVSKVLTTMDSMLETLIATKASA
jgi:flagellar hook-associated protein 1